ncbi:hypothetical protein HMI55_003596, partial [Coelomomyces lativittatus]
MAVTLFSPFHQNPAWIFTSIMPITLDQFALHIWNIHGKLMNATLPGLNITII